MKTLDRNDPEVRFALDNAARAAEHLLEAANGDAARELALDVLNGYLGNLYPRAYNPWEAPHLRAGKLAWAFVLTERRTDLKPHEEKLLELAWEKVREDAVQAEWEAMGL